MKGTHGPNTAVIIPVKPIARAKSRLRPELGDIASSLALAMALDCATAALNCRSVDHVVVVTDDPLVTQEMVSRGAQVLPDHPAGGIDAALAYAAERISPRGLTVALQADLPCIRGEDVERLISRSEDELTTNPSGVFVADAAGVGTTAVVIGSQTPWRTHFGDRSRARHRGAGLIELTDSSLNRMRVDVDTVADVTHARVLGVGPATQTLLGAVAVTIRRPF